MRPFLTIFKALVMFKIVYYFIEFEKNLIETIKTRDVEEITDRLNPRALTKCKTNTLYMAMKVRRYIDSLKTTPMRNLN